jgi:hypothetical protein
MTTKWTSNTIPGDVSSTMPSRVLDNDSVVLLLYGKNSFGDKIYSYIKITLANIKKLKAAIETGKGFTPSDFGEVVAAGRGEPTAELRAEIASMYQVMDVQNSSAHAAAPLPPEKKEWDEY